MNVKNGSSTLIILIIMLSLLLTITAASSYAKESGCITSNCHSGLDKYKYVHGPVAVGECTICHGRSPDHIKKPEKYSFKSINKIAEQCYICHEPSHPRINKGAELKNKCTACHDPHGSSSESFLLN